MQEPSLSVPYLSVPSLANGPWLHVAESAHYKMSAELAASIEAVFTASQNDALAPWVSTGRKPPGASEAETEWAAKAIRHLELPLARHYDFIVVEQGYGGVFVHATDLVARLRERWRVLFLAPGDPFFGAGRHPDDVTLPRLRELDGRITYFNYVSIARSLLRTITSGLLLITHRSQAAFLFDLLPRHRCVIYCDGYYDAYYLNAGARPEGSRPDDRSILRELIYLLAHNPPGFDAVPAGPHCNSMMLWAGYLALVAAEENWCWGTAQRDAFAAGAPQLSGRLRVQLPFINTEVFRPRLVERQPVALFTTTMHNIDKKGIDPILNALRDVESLRVTCVVRQPERLPPIPRQLAPRIVVTSMTKVDMLTTYHRVWVNCRISREESSPVSVLESMACEVPQIVSPIVAQQISLIEDGVTGYIVDPDDRERIAHCLGTLLASPELRDKMGKAARARVLDCGTARRMAEFAKFVPARGDLVSANPAREAQAGGY